MTIAKADKLFREFASEFPVYTGKESRDELCHLYSTSDHTEILSTIRYEVEAIANLFDELYEIGTCMVYTYDEWIPLFCVSIA